MGNDCDLSVISSFLKISGVRFESFSNFRLPGIELYFKSVKELKGKTIGVGSYGSTPDIIARMVVKHYGVDPETEIKMIALGSDSARLTALKEGVVDAIIVAPPVDFEGKKMGFNILSRAGDILRFPYNGLGTSVEKITERPDGVKRVIRAIVRANGFIRRNREGAIQVLVNWTKTKPEFAEAAMIPPSAYSARTGPFPKTAYAS